MQKTVTNLSTSLLIFLSTIVQYQRILDISSSPLDDGKWRFGDRKVRSDSVKLFFCHHRMAEVPHSFWVCDVRSKCWREDTCVALGLLLARYSGGGLLWRLSSSSSVVHEYLVIPECTNGISYASAILHSSWQTENGSNRTFQATDPNSLLLTTSLHKNHPGNQIHMFRKELSIFIEILPHPKGGHASALPQHLASWISLLFRSPTVDFQSLTLPNATSHGKKVSLRHEKESLFEIYDKMSKGFPNTNILCFEEQGILCHMSYKELDSLIDSIAMLVVNYCAQNTSPIVAVHLDRSPLFIASILAILKIGGTYVPIDITWPYQRLQQVIEAIKPVCILSEDSSLPIPSIPLLNPSYRSATSNQSEKIHQKSSQESTPYILFTSGSTGKPKGVAGSQRALINRLEWMYKEYPFSENETVMVKTSVGFVDSLWEIFGGLLSATLLLLVPSSVALDPLLLMKWILTYNVTRFTAVPSLLDAFASSPRNHLYFASLKLLVTSGDTLLSTTVTKVHHIIPESCIFLNLYGCTEVTADASYFPIPRSSPLLPVTCPTISIGKPIQNCTFYIFDDVLQALPFGLAGNLFISGECLASYFSTDGHNSFILHPTLNIRMYKTGDICSISLDGEVTFLGRSDTQIQVRGHRVELGEIEKALLRHENIYDACVLYIPLSPTIKQLVGFVLGQEENKTSLLLYLNAELPSYMVPWKILFLTSFPLTSNGKRDNMKLQETFLADRNHLSIQRSPDEPLDDVEKQLSEIVEKILSFPILRFHESFVEAGGDSISALRLIAMLEDRFSCSLSLRQLFGFPSWLEVLEHIRRHTNKQMLSEDKTGQENIDKDPEVPSSERLKLRAGLAKSENLLLSHGQRGMWFLDHFGNENNYIITTSFYVQYVDPEVFERALEFFINRHPMLRSIYGSDSNGEPTITISPTILISSFLKVEEKSMKEARNTKKLQNFLQQPMNISTGDLPFQVLLIHSTKRNESLLTIKAHHIISDGYSTEIMLRHLNDYYTQYQDKVEPNIELNTIQYNDYAYWQETQLKKEKWRENLFSFWRSHLRHSSLACRSFPSFTPKNLPSKSRTITLTLKGWQVDQLYALAKEHRSTVFVWLMAALLIQIARINSSADVIITTPTAMRQGGVTEIFGMFVNTLPLLFHLDFTSSILEFVSSVQETLFNALDHSELPFDCLVEEFVHKQDRSLFSTPFSDIMFVQHEKSPLEILDESKRLIAYRLNDICQDAAPSPCTIYSCIHDNSISLRFTVKEGIFSYDAHKSMVDTFATCLSGILSNPSLSLSSLPLVPKPILSKPLPLPSDKSLFDYICMKAQEAPHQIALSYRSHSLTYHSLIEKTSIIASWILLNVSYPVHEKNKIIGIFAGKGISSILALLAILAAGYTYTPLDPELPLFRIQNMVKQSKMKLILCDRVVDAICSVPCFSIDTILSQPTKIDLPCTIKPNDTAAVLFTSGTMSEAKGVCLTHENIIALVYHPNWISLDSNDIISQCNTLSFDLALCEIFLALLHGACLHIMDKATLLDTDSLSHYLCTQKISCIILPTSILHMIAQYEPCALQSVRQVIFGGEKANTNACNTILKNGAPNRLINIYGPTEITFACTFHDVKVSEDQLPVPIGIPMTYSRVYIVDNDFNIVPKYSVGEIVVGGRKTANGYLSGVSPSFRSDCFDMNSEHFLYKTGDLGWYGEGGVMFFHSRKDKQTKIRGFRVEPTEVSDTILHHPEIYNSITIVGDREDGKYLASYYEGNCNADELRTFLASRLPNYMVPRFLSQVEKMPLTNRGKIDVSKLPLPHIPTAPVTWSHLELQVKSIFESLLESNITSKETSFFVLGGNSLLGMKLVAKINENITSTAINIRDLFLHPTIEKIASLCSCHKETNKLGVLPSTVKEEKPFPLSRGQLRIWIAQNMAPHSPFYNVPCTMYLRGKVDVTKVQNALEKVLSTFPMLRARILTPQGEEEPIQKYTKHNKVNLILSEELCSPEALSKEIEAAHLSLFQLQGDEPLYRFQLFYVSAEEYILCLTFHHILCDGYSIQKVQTCFVDHFLERSRKVEGNSYPYDCFVEWEKERQGVVEEHEDFLFWKPFLDSFAPVLLPCQCPSSIQMDTISHTVEWRIGSDIYSSFATFCKNNHCTLYVGLLSCFYVLLYRYTSNDELYVSSIVSNRPISEFQETVGFFVNNMVTHASLSADMSFKELVTQIHSFVSSSIRHSTVDLYEIVKAHQKDSPTHQTPYSFMKELLGMVFILQEKQEGKSMKEGENSSSGLSVEPLFMDLPFTKFDFVLECIPLACGELRCIISFTEAAYPNSYAFMTRMVRHFGLLIDSVLLKGGDTRIIDLSYCTEKDVETFPSPLDILGTKPNQSLGLLLSQCIENADPERIAAQSFDEKISWKQVARLVERLATMLIQRGVQVGDRIFVLQKKGVPFFLSFIAILYVGAVYIPITNELPIARIHVLQKLTHASWILTDLQHKSLALEIPSVQCIIIPPIASIQFPVTKEDQHILDGRKSQGNPDSLCYILCTSGTSGTPKAVGISQGNVIARFYLHSPTPLSSRFSTLQLTSVLFDPSLNDMFYVLFGGATLTLLDLPIIDTDAIVHAIDHFHIDMIAISTSYLVLLATQSPHLFKNLKRVTFGGSSFDNHLINTLVHSNPHCAFLNFYGPTETTFVVTGIHLTATNPISSCFNPIGSILPGAYYYIVDKHFQKLPKGIPGELIIGGLTVGSGYQYAFHSKDKDSSTILPAYRVDPFLSEEISAPIYCTGDQVIQRMDDNVIEYCGRNDSQQKVGGYRIDTREIHFHASTFPGVSMVHVTVHDTEIHLIFYGSASPTYLEGHLQGILPPYMIPIIHSYPTPFPFKPNTKWDTKELEKIIFSHNESKFPLPSTSLLKENKISILQELRLLWERALHIPVHDTTQSFFNLGGTSLQLIKLAKQIGVSFPTTRITISDLLRHVSLHQQVNMIYHQYNSPAVVHEVRKKECKKEENDQIVIVGMDCFVPGARGLDEFWNLINRGVDSITRENVPFPKVKAGGEVKEAEFFDFSFFGLSEHDASCMDPQHRCLLESSLNSLQNAGINPHHYQNEEELESIGIFTSTTPSTYNKEVSSKEGISTAESFQNEVSSLVESAATRIAFYLSLLGPAMAIQTACSSSLTAIHIACQSILNDDCSACIVAGSGITFPQIEENEYQAGMILSPTGTCRSFDKDADGIVSGNGTGSIVLMKSSTAKKKGLPIRGIILGSAVNNDGAKKSSYYSGNIAQHVRVIEKAMNRAGVDSVDYVEGHGAGTVLGDLIEVSAFVEAYHPSISHPLILGSIKSNIGHTGPAAGILGLIKTLLALEHQQIPPSLHCNTLHPGLLELSPHIIVPKQNMEWKVNQKKHRTAAIHSFGQGGTNAHLILQEAPRILYQITSTLESRYEVIMCSGASFEQLKAQISNLLHFLHHSPTPSFESLAWSLQSGRIHKAHRKTFICPSAVEAESQLQNYLHSHTQSISPPIIPHEECNFVFFFPGQGTQFLEMGSHLEATFPSFRNAMNDCRQLISQIDSIPLEGNANDQLRIFSIGWSLSSLLKSFGIAPKVMMGHSFGEYLAACLSGVMTLKDAIYLLAYRGYLMNQTLKGKMIAVRTSLSEDLESSANSFHVDMAAHNSSHQVIFSGFHKDIDRWAEYLQKELSLKVTTLNVSFAFHSRLMGDVLPQFREIISKVKLSPPTLPFISCVTGTWITKDQAINPDYWTSHIRKPVLFYDALQTCFSYLKSKRTSSVPAVLVSVGPANWMQNVARTEAKMACLENVSFSPSIIHPKKHSVVEFLRFLGHLWEAGTDINWRLLHTTPVFTVALPPIAYQRKLCRIRSKRNSHRSSVQERNPPSPTLTSAVVVSRSEFESLQVQVEKLATLLSDTRNEMVKQGKERETRKGNDAIWSDQFLASLTSLKNQSNHPKWKLSIGLMRNESSEVLQIDANLRKMPNPQNLQFPIGCLSSCYVIMLFEDMIFSKEIDRFELVSDCLPSSWDCTRIQGIRLHHLASHTSGLPCIPPPFKWNAPKSDPLSLCNFGIANLQKLLCTEDLLFMPGTHSYYSPLGIVLLSCCLLSRLGGQEPLEDISFTPKLESFLTARIFSQNSQTTASPIYIDLGYSSMGKKVKPWRCGPLFGIADGLYSTMHDVQELVQNLPDDVMYYMMKNEELDVYWSVGLTPSSSVWIGYCTTRNISVVLSLNTEMDISLELTKLGEQYIRMLMNEPSSYPINECSCITPAILRLWKGEKSSPHLLDHYSITPAPVLQKARLAPSPSPTIPTDFELLVEEVISGVLFSQRREMNRKETFEDAGIDSLQILVIAAGLQKKLSFPLHVMDLFTYNTISLLAAHLSIKQKGKEEILKRLPVPPNLNLCDSFYDYFCFTNHVSSQILPLVLKPKQVPKNVQNLFSLLRVEKDAIRLLLDEYGAVLLRDFLIDSAEEFAEAVEILFPDSLSRAYLDGISPRSSVLADQVFTSTEYPQKYNMDVHNEMSYSPSPPEYILFYCSTPPSLLSGGETPIADSRTVYLSIPCDIREMFEEKGILYVTNLPSKEGGHKLGLSWQSTYATEDPVDVEKFCDANGIEYEWVHPEDGIASSLGPRDYNERKITLRTKRRCPAIRVDMKSKQKNWFNHAHLFHPSDLHPSMRDGMRQLMTESLFPKNCCFGDGSPIPSSYLDIIRDAMRRSEREFSWQQGDILLINNLRIAHGRHAFKGQRKIFVAMK